MISCDRPYGCSGHNDVRLDCDNNEDCTISCTDFFACRDLDIYGPTNELSNDQLSLTIDCTAKYACYGVMVNYQILFLWQPMYGVHIHVCNMHNKEYTCVEALTNLLYYIRFKHCSHLNFTFHCGI